MSSHTFQFHMVFDALRYFVSSWVSDRKSIWKADSQNLEFSSFGLIISKFYPPSILILLEIISNSCGQKRKWSIFILFFFSFHLKAIWPISNNGILSQSIDSTTFRAIFIGKWIFLYIIIINFINTLEIPKRLAFMCFCEFLNV